MWVEGEGYLCAKSDKRRVMDEGITRRKIQKEHREGRTLFVMFRTKKDLRDQSWPFLFDI